MLLVDSFGGFLKESQFLGCLVCQLFTGIYKLTRGRVICQLAKICTYKSLQRADK